MTTEKESLTNEKQETIPRGQAIFDHIIILLVLSLVVSLLLYNGWGILELLLVPPSP